MKRKNPKGVFEPYRVLVFQDGQKVFKEYGSKEKVSRGLRAWWAHK